MKGDKKEIEQLKEGINEIKECEKKTAEELERKIQKISSTKPDGMSWENIVSKEEVSKNV